MCQSTFLLPLDVFVLFWTVMLVSFGFIVLILIVHICIPELCEQLNKKCLMCYLVFLGIFYGTLGWIHANDTNYVEPDRCKAIGFVLYFSLLSVATWSNVISFDLFLSFRWVSCFFLEYLILEMKTSLLSLANSLFTLKKANFQNSFAVGNEAAAVVRCVRFGLAVNSRDRCLHFRQNKIVRSEISTGYGRGRLLS